MMTFLDLLNDNLHILQLFPCWSGVQCINVCFLYSVPVTASVNDVFNNFHIEGELV